MNTKIIKKKIFILIIAVLLIMASLAIYGTTMPKIPYANTTTNNMYTTTLEEATTHIGTRTTNTLRTTAGSNIISGIDYSGQGTKISGELASGEAMISGNYLDVPIYKGKYDTSWYNVNDWWLWHSWSDWSPSNNKINDYHTYVGQTMTEYDVESKEEHMYHRYNPDINPVYKTKYYTEFKTVTKILFVTITTYHTESSWNGYPGAISGKTIHKRWEKSEFSHNSGGYETTGWRNSAPITLSFWPFNEPAYTLYQTRTTYRYRSRTIDWNAHADTTTEQVPLNYALYNENIEPLNLGIRLDINTAISQGDNRTALEKLLLPTKPENCYNVTQYYVHINEIEMQIRDQLMATALAGEPIAEFIISNIAKGLWVAIGYGLERYGKKAVFESLGSYMMGAQFILTGVDSLLQHLKKQSIKDFYALLQSIDDDDKILLIQETTHHDLNSYADISFPVTNVKLIILEEDLQYVSLKYDSARANKYGVFNYSNHNYYGEVSYIKDTREVTGVISSYLNSYDILNWASFIPS